jgi:pyridoxine 4-dehydrogenase
MLKPFAVVALSLICTTPSLLAVPLKIGRVQAGPISLSALGCGTWSWGNRLLWNYDPSQDEEIYAAYRVVRDAGVTLFDTADSYGTLDLNGRAEILLGEFERRYQTELQQSGAATSTDSNPWWRALDRISNKQSISNLSKNSNKQQVATKFAPYPWRITSTSIVKAAKESLNRLQQQQTSDYSSNTSSSSSKLAIAQLHWSTANYQPWQEGALWKGLGDVYDAGMCDAVGVSNYGPIQLEKIAAYLKNERAVPLATAQIQYSLMTFPTARAMNDICDSENIRLISYSPLCLGLLTGRYDLDNLPRPGNPRRQLFRELLPGARELLSTLTAVGKEYNNSSPSQVAINWCVCKNTVPIPGCRTVQQARDNVSSVLMTRLRPDAVEELDRVALRVKKPMIQNVFQTR